MLRVTAALPTVAVTVSVVAPLPAATSSCDPLSTRITAGFREIQRTSRGVSVAPLPSTIVITGKLARAPLMSTSESGASCTCGGIVTFGAVKSSEHATITPISVSAAKPTRACRMPPPESRSL